MCTVLKCQAAGEQPAAGGERNVVFRLNPIIPQSRILSSPFSRRLSRDIDICLAAQERAGDVVARRFWEGHKRWLEGRIGGRGNA